MEKLLENLPKREAKVETARSLPETPGIYCFFKNSKVLYVGKAINLKRRVGSYFDLHLEPKTAAMISEATELSFIQVTSELEALLLEAKLIRTYMPQYNIAAKDDKHPLYIIITRERYPRVLSARKLTANDYKLKASYGPFPSSTSVRSVLRMIRRIFPYSDHKIGKRACMYSHIGLCRPCPSEIAGITDEELKEEETRKYLKNIRRIKSILDGKTESLRKELEEEMISFSGKEDYESAIAVRDQIKRLEYITQPQIPTEYFMENPNLYSDIRKKELSTLSQILEKNGLWRGYSTRHVELKRIECFDIAHLAGTSPTASMVTLTDGEIDKKYYRHFRIYQKKGNSDVDSLREVIRRRIKHFSDWGRPDLIIVDGGKPQVGVFIRELEETGIPVVGLAKRFETLVIPAKIDGTLKLKEYRVPKGPALNLVQRIRDEAHRFARVYHHKLISKEMINTGSS